MRRTAFLILALAVALTSTVVYAKWPTVNSWDDRLSTTVDQVNASAAASGDQATVEFLASELDVSPTTLTQERTQFGVNWGDLLLAHTFQQMARNPTTIDQIFAMRAQGMPWTMISWQLRFGVGQAARAAQTTATTLTSQTSGGTTTGTTTTGTTSGTTSGTTDGTTSGTTTNGTTTNGTTTGTTDDNQVTDGTTEVVVTRTSPAAPGVDRKVRTLATQFESDAESRGDQSTAERFADRFDVTTDVLLAELDEFDTEWGDLFVAHVIQERSRTDVTLADIFSLRDQGLTWTQIARQYRIPPGQLLKAVRVGTTSFTTISSGDQDMTVTKTARTNGSGDRMRSGGSGTTKLGHGSKWMGSATTKRGSGGATRMAGLGATKMGGASATKMGGASAIKMGGASVTRMSGASVTRMAGASMTRIGGGVGHAHGHGGR